MKESTSLNALENALVKKLLGNNKIASSFIKFIFRASLQGHLCVMINENKILPNPRELLLDCEDDIRAGIDALPENLVCHVNLTSEATLRPICKHGVYYYFHRYWIEELKIFKALQSILKSQPSLKIDVNSSELLNTEQASAVKKASQNCLTIICGGPGTGKTFTAGQLIKMIWKNLSETERDAFEIVLAAPTGKAASNLESSIKNAVQKVDHFPEIKSKTLHALLTKNKNRFLSADLLIIDECSMMDVDIMRCLLTAIKPGARIIMLGDPNQLPPVESGSIFSDIVEYLKNRTCVVELKTCVRTELDHLLNFAREVKDGFFIEATNRLKNDSALLPLKSHDDFLPLLDFPFEYNGNDFIALIKRFQMKRLLSPLREGLFGVEKVNQAIFSNLKSNSARCVIPIIILKNDYQLGLFNGETGILVHHFLSSKEDFAVFPIANNALRSLPAMLLPKYEYAYCLSVHKSQGSEYDEVLLLMPEQFSNYTREIIYTAATRAKKKLWILGEEKVLERAIEKKCSRLSGLFCMQR